MNPPRTWTLDLDGNTALCDGAGRMRAVLSADERVGLACGSATERISLGHLLEWLPKMPSELPAEEVSHRLGEWVAERLSMAGAGICVVPSSFGVRLRRGLKRGLEAAGALAPMVDASAALRAGALAHPAVSALCRPGVTLALDEEAPGRVERALWFQLGEGTAEGSPLVAEPLPGAPQRTLRDLMRAVIPAFPELRRRGARLLAGAEVHGEEAQIPTLVRRSVLAVRDDTGAVVRQAVLPSPDEAPLASFDFTARADDLLRLHHRWHDQGRNDETSGASFSVPRGAQRVTVRVDREARVVIVLASRSGGPGPHLELAGISWAELVPPAVL